jgi:hypothetical protein
MYFVCTHKLISSNKIKTVTYNPPFASHLHTVQPLIYAWIDVYKITHVQNFEHMDKITYKHAFM